MAQENKTGLFNKILSVQTTIFLTLHKLKQPVFFLVKGERNAFASLKNHQFNLINAIKKLKFYLVFNNETK